jgi:hypothetical protein
MEPTLESKYEEQFTAFIDLLGFREFSSRADAESVEKRGKVLEFLSSLSALRGDFSFHSMRSSFLENANAVLIKPAISTFSDHIVISYPLAPICSGTGVEPHFTEALILGQFNLLLTRIASTALRLGFLVRGGATIGRLYHAQGVVFGDALVEAYEIESRTSIYPRVVLSHGITSRPGWNEKRMEVIKGDDGLYHINYFRNLALTAVPSGDTYPEDIKAWFAEVIARIASNLTELESKGRLRELAKWAWFAREFRSGMERPCWQHLKALGISAEEIPSSGESAV